MNDAVDLLTIGTDITPVGYGKEHRRVDVKVPRDGGQVH
jgi:hypothetical protein